MVGAPLPAQCARTRRRSSSSGSMRSSQFSRGFVDLRLVGLLIFTATEIDLRARSAQMSMSEARSGTRMAQQAFDGLCFYHLAQFQHGDIIGDLGHHTYIMGSEQHRRSLFLAQFGDQ